MGKSKQRMIEINLKSGIKIHKLPNSTVWVGESSTWSDSGHVHNGYWTYRDLSLVSWAQDRLPIPKVIFKFASRLGIKVVRMPFTRTVLTSKGYVDKTSYGYVPVRKLVQLQKKRRSVKGFYNATFVLYKKSDFQIKGE